MNLPETINAPFTPSLRAPQYRIVDEHAIYEATWQGRPYEIWPLPETQNTAKQCVDQGFDLDRQGPWTFNYAVRRQPCSLISGDLPRVALVETLAGKDLNPPFIRYGDLRIRLVIGDDSFWLDERGTITTQYFPWGTVHSVDLRPDFPLVIEMTAALAENSGLAARLQVAGEAATPLEFDLALYYGGLDQNMTQYWAEYLRAHAAGYPWHAARLVAAEDDIILSADSAEFSNPEIPFDCVAASSPAVTPEIVDAETWMALNYVPGEEALRARIPGGCRPEYRAVFRYHVDTAEPPVIDLLAWKTSDPAVPTLDISRVEDYMACARQYYADLLAPYAIETSDPLLNAAFYSALVNFDYVYHAPAWLEGVHEWNSYFSDNYQISTATIIGQLDRAREALLFFGEHPAGPGAIYGLDGTVDNYNTPGDGLPYYLLQLYRYWRATGDKEVLRRVWAPTCRVLETLLTERDPDGDLLLDWHAGCNVFLYQSDHLSLPGAAASPSLMMAGLLSRMAEMSGSLGEDSQATAWRKRSRAITHEILCRLWLEDEGRFTSGIDPQGLVQQAAYYTDYIFPLLYADLPAEFGRRSLQALDRDLWIGDHLLRTGNYRPDFFGNNAVHHTAMCESAEAYCRAGRAQRVWALLHGTAQGATICTDSPGAFPEYCTTTGWGLADYIFGNDIAAYLHAVISGLFGLERGSEGIPVRWHPCLPAAWEHARLRLDDIEMRIDGTAGDRRYDITFPTPLALEVEIPLLGYAFARLADAHGREIPYAVVEGSVRFTLPPARQHAFHLQAAPQPGCEPETIPIQAQDAAFTYHPIPGPRKPLDLIPWFNSEAFPSVNHGRPCRFDLAQDVEDGEWLRVGDARFRVRPSGRNLVQLSPGCWNRDCNRIESATVPKALTLPVQRAVAGVEFLCGADLRCRLTGMTVGQVILRYADGSEAHTPLIYGDNLDCSVLPFATGVIRRTLCHDPVIGFPISVAAFTVPADPRRVLDTVTIGVFAVDTVIGVLAGNGIG